MKFFSSTIRCSYPLKLWKAPSQSFKVKKVFLWGSISAKSFCRRMAVRLKPSKALCFSMKAKNFWKSTLSVYSEASRKLSSIYLYFFDIKSPSCWTAANFHSWVLLPAKPPPIDFWNAVCVPPLEAVT